MLDTTENGYWLDKDDAYLRGDKYNRNLDHFLRSRSENLNLPEALWQVKGARLLPSGSMKVRKRRSNSIPAANNKLDEIFNDPILSGGPQR